MTDVRISPTCLRRAQPRHLRAGARQASAHRALWRVPTFDAFPPSPSLPLQAMAAPAERLRVIGLVSGGKDSMWALCETRRLGHAIECLANLRPPPASGGGGDGDGDELDSLLVQTVGHACVPAIAACLTPDSGAEGGTPLVRRVTRGRAVCTALGYAPSTPASAAAAAASAAAKDAGDHDAAPSELDEVEDLALLLGECVRRFPRANAVVCGAVLSHYQRQRVEAVCRRLALQPLAWLWGRGQRGLLNDMVSGGVEAVLVKVAAFGLSPAMLGRPVGELRADFARLGDLVGLNECGEGGEYETITLDCPLFETHRVALGRVRVVEARSGGGGGATAHLAVLECGTEPKAALARSLRRPFGFAEDVNGEAPSLMAVASREAQRANDDHELAAAPEGRVVYASSVVAEPAGVDRPAETLADEVRRAFSVLRRRLALAGAALADVCFVHLCEPALASRMFACAHPLTPSRRFAIADLEDMRSFSEANAAFAESFLDLHPPARSSVQVWLRGDASVGAGPRIMLDAVAITGGAAAAAAGRSDVRATLNVGSRSLWAPQCIGPYCQANVLRRQIGKRMRARRRGRERTNASEHGARPRMTKQSLRSGVCLNDHYHQDLRQRERAAATYARLHAARAQSHFVPRFPISQFCAQARLASSPQACSSCPEVRERSSARACATRRACFPRAARRCRSRSARCSTCPKLLYLQPGTSLASRAASQRGAPADSLAARPRVQRLGRGQRSLTAPRTAAGASPKNPRLLMETSTRRRRTARARRSGSSRLGLRRIARRACVPSRPCHLSW